MGDTALPIAAGHEIIGGAGEKIDAFHFPGGGCKSILGSAFQVLRPGIPCAILKCTVMHLFVPYGKEIDAVWTPGYRGWRNLDGVPVREIFPARALPSLVLIDPVVKMTIWCTDKDVQAAFLPGRYGGRARHFNANIFCLPIRPR